MKDNLQNLLHRLPSFTFHQDYWSYDGALWTKHHVKPRSRLSVPLNQYQGPPLDRLWSRRVSNIRPSNTRSSEVIEPFTLEDVCNTRDLVQYEYERDLTINGLPQCINYTQLEESESDDIGVFDDLNISGSALQHQGLQVPIKPSSKERALDIMTHLEFRTW